MRKLERSPAPACLSRYKHGRDSWTVITESESYKDDIWQQLTDMQNAFCAYCESRLHDRKRHIEHFFKRENFPQLTFDWGNIFGSCNELDSCGNHKDHKTQRSIDLSKVCKPDTMNPAQYLLFLSDGHVMPRDELEPADAEIAENTINVFNLSGSPKLVGKRRAAMRAERPLAEAYFQAMNDCLGEPELESLLDQELEVELARISSSEYSVALRQVWEV